ncbi:MAG TPA: hypothetical protein VH583_07860 [Vicinamibacterales bacterium]
MRVAAESHTGSVPAASAAAGAPVAVDPSAPDLTPITRDFAGALKSFYATVQAVIAANPVDIPRLQTLATTARAGKLGTAEAVELQALTQQATKQGKAVGAVIGFFLKFKPYPMLAEIRSQAKLFQPPFGPLLVVEGDAVRDVFSRDQEFTVEPYGVEMCKVMSPAQNGGFSTFILSTDDTSLYAPDKQLLSAVCCREDADRITDLIHTDSMKRIGAALAAARANGSTTIDVVQAVARYVPVTLGHHYLGVPVAAQPGSFDLTPDMLACYGTPLDGRPETALGPKDGIIPDERQMYLWIKAAFQHFFNNVQKDPVVQVEGLRSCRLLLAYLLRELDIQRTKLLAGEAIDDTMLTRLLRFQLNQSSPTVKRPADLDHKLVSDMRIAENVMSTIVGAVAGQEEATCRVIDSLIRLKDGEYKPPATPNVRVGTFEEARRRAVDVLSGTNAADARAALRTYFLEALRLQPQGEVLLRKCVSDGARIADSRPIAAGTLVFASHGSAMKDVPDPDSFVLNRPAEDYLQYGWKRHTCLGQFVSPVVIVETMAALLGLQDLARADAKPGESAFPIERRTGQFQLDDQCLYATTFTLRFADSGTTRQFWPN